MFGGTIFTYGGIHTMMIRPHIHKLMDSDILGWHPDQMPRYWIQIVRGRNPWERKLSNIKGLHIRVRWFGIKFHFGHGQYGRNSISWGPFKAVFYWMDDYQTWLESWCGY